MSASRLDALLSYGAPPSKKKAAPMAMARAAGRPTGRATKAPPRTRHFGKPSEPGPASAATTAASQKKSDEDEAEAFWKDFAAESAVHAAKTEKAAKIIRDTVITRKAAGRTVPTKVTYQRTTTESSDVPLKKPKVKVKAK